MQLQLCSVFFTFSLGTRTHYFGRTILHGGAKVCLFLSFHTHTSTYILGNWFLCFLNFANSTEQLVEVLWYVTSSLLKITGSTQEVILLKREYIYMNDFLLFSFSNGTCHPESRWGWEELGWFCLLKVVFFVTKHSTFSFRLEVALLLIVYIAYGYTDGGAVSFVLLTLSSWFLVISWLFAPYIFNPSGFEWQK